MTPQVFAAVDIGASGGRVMAGVVDEGGIRLEPVHRFPNGATQVDGHLRWSLTKLYEEVRTGLARIPEARSASTPGPSTTASSTPRATCSPSRSPTATTARPG